MYGELPWSIRYLKGNCLGLLVIQKGLLAPLYDERYNTKVLLGSHSFVLDLLLDHISFLAHEQERFL